MGVLELMDRFPLTKVEKIFEFWTEITLPMEEREKRMRTKADKAANEAANLLLNAKINKETIAEDESSLNRFFEVYKQKT